MSDIWSQKVPRVDQRLNWSPQHDPRSLDYPIRELTGDVVDMPKTWRPGVVLDQGHEGACVGFGHTGDLLASPRPATVTSVLGNLYARGVYQRAKVLDDWPGEDYDGTSVLAGGKVQKERGLIGSYRWAFGIEDVRAAIIAKGPVVIGVPWYRDMYETKANGMVTVGGDLVGGHCILVNGYHPGLTVAGESGPQRVFRWRNSWGSTYGKSGNGLVRYEDLRDLLKGQGEAFVAVDRKYLGDKIA